MIDERGLPANLDAERLVLGSVLLDGAQYAEVAASLERDDFSIEKHRRIYDRMGDIAGRGDSLDRVTLAEELNRRGQLESVDGLSYLATLDEGLPKLASVEGYIRIVKDKATLRRAIVVCHETIGRLTAAGPDAIEDIRHAERVLRDLSAESAGGQRLKDPIEIISSVEGGYAGFLEPHKRPRGIPTPWPKVSEMMTGGGFRPGQLWTLAALTSRGKSAAALQCAEEAARLGHGVAVFAVEMSGEEVLSRMACSRAKVDARKWAAGYASDAEMARIRAATSEIGEFPLYIDDSTTASLPAIDSALRKLVAKRPINLIVIDYIQIMRAAGRHENRAQEVGAIARGCKLLAREYRCPVLMLSQFNRANKQDERPPQLEDLKESSEIEQASDGIIFLHSKRSDWLNGEPYVPVEMIFAKQRGGPTGYVHDGLIFHRQYVRFGESMADFEVQP